MLRRRTIFPKKIIRDARWTDQDEVEDDGKEHPADRLCGRRNDESDHFSDLNRLRFKQIAPEEAWTSNLSAFDVVEDGGRLRGQMISHKTPLKDGIFRQLTTINWSIRTFTAMSAYTLAMLKGG
mgnify:CR=1 FL=1